VIADDSGLEVEQLNGEPGVYSARYAGEGCTYDDNNIKLLKELEPMPEPHTAKFVSCAVYYDGENYFCETGEIKGRIVRKKKGDKGFGYDPVFMPDGFNKTLAELELTEKNNISHRAGSFNKLRNKLIKEGIL
ncbi:MAG: non-canonical purine NTP pyrophosphatase, partial [Syntrophothermus sp.]